MGRVDTKYEKSDKKLKLCKRGSVFLKDRNYEAMTIKY